MMRKWFVVLCMSLAVTTFAQKKEWLDPAVNQINRRPPGLLILLIPVRNAPGRG